MLGGQLMSAGASFAGAIAPPLAQGIGVLAPPTGRAIVGSARLGGRAALGSARLGSAAARNLANAFHGLVQAGLPMSHRGDDYLQRAGVSSSGVTGMLAVHRW